MKFLITLFKDGKEYGGELEALTVEDAQRSCDAMGWRLDGELYMSIPADQTTQEEVQQLVNDLADGKRPLH